MKKLFIFMFLIFMFSCKKENVINDFKIVTQFIAHNSIVDQECVFDQTTQTDAFLKDKKELEGYVWHDEIKSAEIILNEHWFLTITRGGCDHFLLSAEFRYDRKLKFEANKEYILDKIIWITSILNEDFENEVIKKCIIEDKMTFTKTENGLYGNFMDSKIYEMYTFDYETEKESTIFSISFYLN
ncbi:hypothetical protein [uncultured Olleya sp.]|uniref:hypothetical protein n=1 Tax=uncultured Olleya sp. TaxID=757243 RepID=UPI002591B9E9|nr:hypothetical protein [uncultured Olleya sp.]